MTLRSLHQQNHFPEDMQKKHVVGANEAINIDDIQLWQEFQSGSETAYATIYRNNASLLYSYGLKLIKDKDLIKDCIQDLFVEIWDTKHKLGTVRSIKSYLYKSIRRRLISESVKHRATIGLTTYPDTIAHATPSAEWSLLEKQKFDQQRLELKKVLGELTDRQREIIHLKYYARLSYEEIAEVMSLSKKGTYKLMGRAISFLRKHMGTTFLLTFSLLFRGLLRAI